MERTTKGSFKDTGCGSNYTVKNSFIAETKCLYQFYLVLRNSTFKLDISYRKWKTILAFQCYETIWYKFNFNCQWLYRKIHYLTREFRVKDVRAKIFHSIDFLKFLLQSDNELLVPEMQKKLGVTVFVSDIKRVENCPDFDKLALVIQHGLQWFIVKISKVSQQRQTSLVLFCRTLSVA